MHKIFFLSAALTLAATAHAYTIIDGTLRQSKIYPETVHTYKISLPEGYSGGETCLYVGLDGILCDAPARIDSLIAAGDIPQMAGIYLQPGIIYGDDCKTVLRYNRSNEFDATDTRFARFLEEELIPAAVATARKAGHELKIKEGGENAMIFGLSSGGIAAFTAAWHRPQLFSRVFSGCGTFVPMRGGNDLQAIVRKAEPKQLRIFLQDGYSDTWNPLFGSWFEANQLMGSALEFAGYDYAFDWAEGGHSVKRSSEIFTDVMKWLWRGYPAPLEKRSTGNETVARMLDGAGEWVKYPYEPYEPNTNAAVYPDGSLRAMPDRGNQLSQELLRPDGMPYAAQRFYWLHSYNNNGLQKGGMTFDGDGYLWVITDAGIQVCDQNGRVRAIFDLPFDASKIGGNSNGRRRAPRASTRMEVNDGEIVVYTPDAIYRRKMNVRGAVPGVRPAPEGQG